MPALAFSNNDIAVVAWTFDRHLDGCLGFAIIQIDAAGKERPLPALASFAGQPKDPHRTTEQAPVQKFWWKDLYARRGETYTYRIVPMGGTPGALKPLAGVDPLVSNSVTLTPKRPPFNAYFNRGIVATQALSHALNDKPSIDALTPHILDPNDPIRQSLQGQLFEGVTSLLDRADTQGGTIHAALYELNDPNGLEKRLQADGEGDPKSRNVILGNEQGVGPDKKPIEDTDAKNRANLKAAGVNVIDRILGKGSIPHNKFMVLSQGDAPVAVLTGSTNWTSTGLCTQTNNALVIESAALAQRYIDYWTALQADIAAAGGDQKKLQSSTQRTWDHANNDKSVSAPIDLGAGVSIEPMFSPNTNHPLRSPPKEKPNDMERIFDLIGGAKQAVLFLAFDPGNNSILDAAGQALAKNPDLFVRGALTSAQRASNFSAALHQGGAADEGEGPQDIKVVGEVGTPKKKGAKPAKSAAKGAANGKTPAAPIDYRSIPAGSVTSNDAFGAWEAELQKYGFAIIHNKIVVIDPFSSNCTVVTGSHNLGFRASHNNDENLVIVRGHRGLAEAYACHVLDIYDHYAWRYWLREKPDVFGKPLAPDDTWQERYILGPAVKSPELRFWLAAAGAGVAGSAPKASGPVPTAKPPAGSGGGGGGASGGRVAPASRTAAKRKPAAPKAAKRAPAKKRPSKHVSGRKAAGTRKGRS
ncbi:MAG TPA: phospholipase D-like domain-containing protein [Xanthobacteraceae bacterium]|nr:phospholipase D-like domain-containing protein [Xanthobacteraceae bacterium]